MRRIFLLCISFVMAITTSNAQTTYTITDLSMLPGYSDGYAINNSGQVTGTASTSTGYHIFLYTPSVGMTDLGTLLGGVASFGYGINSSGQITGYSIPGGAFLYTPGSGIVSLGSLPGASGSIGNSINSSGQVTGGSGSYGFLYTPGVGMVDLGTLPGGTNSRGSGINSSGQITGSSNTGTGRTHAFLYSPGGGMVDLGTLPAYTESFGSGINESGQVTGFSTNGTVNHAFLYSGGAMTDIGTLGGSYSAGVGINASGQVTGQSTTTGNIAAQHAFLYTPGSGIVDLNTLLPGGSGWTLTEANSINNSGQITGVGTNANGQQHAYLLTPSGNTNSHPSIGASLNPTTFASTVLGTTSSAVLTVANTGNAPLSISGINTSLPFAVSVQIPATIAASSQVAYTVTFAPQSVGTFTGNLRITSNGSNSPTLTIPLQGTAIPHPVIVIPGIMGTVLRQTDNNAVLWLNSIDVRSSSCDESLLALSLSDAGETPAQPFSFQCYPPTSALPIPFFTQGATVRPTELLVGNTGPQTDFYSKLLAAFPNASGFAYDWRLSYTTIIAQLRDAIIALAPSQSDSVDLVAHSQGGLIARAYLGAYASDNRVHSIVYLGTPHLGATKSFAALAGWQDFDKYYGSGELFGSDFLNFKTMTYVSRNFPSLYDLLPRFDFFSENGALEAFTTSTQTKLKNVNLVNQADVLWGALIRHNNPIARSFAVNGSGQNTLKFLIQDPSLACLIPLNDSTGDGTVPTMSGNGLEGVTYFYVNQEHGKLPNDSNVIQMVQGILQNGTPPASSAFTLAPFSLGKNIRAYTCSPVKMQVFDSHGDMSGLDNAGDLVQNIPNSQFFAFPENEGVLVSGGDQYHVFLQPTDSGTFSLIFDLFDSDQLIQSFSFNDIPINMNSRAELLFDPSAASQTLKLDVNGDGIPDYLIASNSPPPAAAFASVLIGLIKSFDLPTGIETDLDSVLNASLNSLGRGQNEAARNQLMALHYKVSALQGKQLTDQQVQSVIKLVTKAAALLQSKT